MSRTIENDCVGCPQGCVNCGRAKDYTLVTCDFCDNIIIYDDLSEISRINDEYDICPSCKEDVIEQLDTIDNALDDLKEVGRKLCGIGEWNHRVSIINDLLQGIKNAVE